MSGTTESNIAQQNWKFLTDLARLRQEEQSKHVARINFIDLAEAGGVEFSGEITVSGLVDANLRQISGQELVAVKPGEPVRHVKLDELTVAEILPTELVSDGIIQSLSLTSTGTFALNKQGQSKVTVGDLNDRTGDKNFDLAEATSYGFLADGRFVHLDEAGIVNIDGQPAGLNRIMSRKFRKDRTLPVVRLEVNGTLILLEEFELNEDRRKAMREPIHWIGKRPRDYYMDWYYIRHRVVEVRPEGVTPVLSTSAGATEEQLAEPGYSQRVLQTGIHSGGFASFVHEHQRDSVSDAFYDLPLYDRVAFYAPGAELGSSKADSSLLGKGAITISQDGSTGFVGKNDGTIEVVDLRGRPDIEALFDICDQQGTQATLSEDPYPYRQPSEAVTFWKAHDSPVARLFSAGDEVYSVDTTGVIRRWHLGERQAA